MLKLILLKNSLDTTLIDYIKLVPFIRIAALAGCVGGSDTEHCLVLISKSLLTGSNKEH